MVSKKWAALAALLTAEALDVLNTTIVQVAGPSIHASLGGATSDIQWFGTAYTLPFALLLITGGRLGDIFGRRRVFRAGVTVFLLAALACAFSPSVGLLIGLRAVQGAAAALTIPQTIGLIKAMFRGPEMSRALGCIGPVMGLAAVCGPVLGGVLTHGSSWRAAFLVNVPLCVAVLALSRLLVEDKAPQRPRIDLPGTALAMGGIGLVVYPLITLSSWVLLIAGAVLLGGFALRQRRHPVVEPELLARRGLPTALVTSTLFFSVTTGLALVVTLHLQFDLGYDVLAAGLGLLPWSVGLGVASWVAGSRLVPRFGHRVMYGGLAVVLAGIAAGAWWLPAGLGVIGVGAGLFTPGFFTGALSQVEPQETGSAAGLLNAVQQLGGTLGVAVLGSLYLASGFGAALAAAAAVIAVTLSTIPRPAGTPRRPEPSLPTGTAGRPPSA
ncbi:MFS transporter [Nonomuraea sp. NPDC050536]|uniref:MFS transporter n=1 Tax=Nonomuraea sp. NPDC050536 TaxID=3364366 RepID=UPI0037C63488